MRNGDFIRPEDLEYPLHAIWTRVLYEAAYADLRGYMNFNSWDRDTAAQFRIMYPQPIRRAAARSYNARRYAPHVWEHDNARAKYERGWLPW